MPGHHLWLFCKHCGLHKNTHYYRVAVADSCLMYDPGLRFERKTPWPDSGLYEWCRNCNKHVRHHYGDEKPPRCQPKPEADAQELAELAMERLRPMPCPEHGVCLQDPCQPQLVESSVMDDNQRIFSQSVTSRTVEVSKGIRNYPIVEGQSSAIQMFGMPSSNAVSFGMSTANYQPPAVSGSLPRPIDPVNPRHYRGDLVMRIIEHFGLHENFYLGNVIKYILRHAEKAGLEDLKKARWYLDRMIEREEGRHTKGVE